MATAFAIGLLSVALGAYLGIARSRWKSWFAPVYTFALAAVVTSVVVHLLPEAAQEIGLWAFAVFAVGIVGPSVGSTVLQRLMRTSSRAHDHRTIALELGFIGLLIHKFADGYTLGLFTSPLHDSHAHFDVVVGVGVHSIPIVAAAVLALVAAFGVRAAIAHAIALAGATCIGVFAASADLGNAIESAQPWVSSGVAGLLLHVLSHDVPRPKSRTTGVRTAELIAVAIGIALPLLSGGHHDHTAGTEPGSQVLDALVNLSLEAAPMLVIGFSLGAVIHAFGARIPTRWLRSPSAVRSAVRGAIVGAPLPICSCGVLPIAGALHRQGANAGFVVAFLFATPELGVETFALSVKFLGWQLAGIRIAAAIALAFVAAVVVSKCVGPAAIEPLTSEMSPLAPTADRRSVAVRMLDYLEELLVHTGPWIILGLVVAAYLEVLVPESAMANFGSSGLDVVVVSLLAVPTYLCASSATPLAAVLIAKGISPGAALAALLLGPATNVATLGFLRKTYGTSALSLGMGAAVVCTWVIAWSVNGIDIPVGGTAAALGEHSAGLLAVASGALLTALAAYSIWRSGLRAWVGQLSDQDHDHGHGHGHDHE